MKIRELLWTEMFLANESGNLMSVNRSFWPINGTQPMNEVLGLGIELLATK